MAGSEDDLSQQSLAKGSLVQDYLTLTGTALDSVRMAWRTQSERLSRLTWVQQKVIETRWALINFHLSTPFLIHGLFRRAAIKEVHWPRNAKITWYLFLEQNDRSTHRFTDDFQLQSAILTRDRYHVEITAVLFSQNSLVVWIFDLVTWTTLSIMLTRDRILWFH